jgi:hypothetical protein
MIRTVLLQRNCRKIHIVTEVCTVRKLVGWHRNKWLADEVSFSFFYTEHVVCVSICINGYEGKTCSALDGGVCFTMVGIETNIQVTTYIATLVRRTYILKNPASARR